MTPMRSERDIDEAIDQAVRDIMTREPGRGLRARVLAEIQRPRARAAFALRMVSAVAAAAVVVIAAAVLLLRSGGLDPVNLPLAQVSTPAAAPQVPVTTPSRPGLDLPGDRGVPVAPPARRNRDPRASAPAAAPVFPERGAVAAASVVETADVRPFATEPAAAPGPASNDSPPIVIREIQIAPLVVERLAVSPIPPPR